MRRLIPCLLLLLSCKAFPTDLVLKNCPAQVFFSPNGGCQDAVVAAIDGAKREIRVQAYSFTSAPIAGSLKRAHDRGVDVRVLLDKNRQTERYSGLTSR